MFPPDDAPPAARLSRWLDGWLEPRWRAVLTWMALAALMRWALVDLVTPRRLRAATALYFDTLNRAFHSPLPGALFDFSYVGTIFLLGCWFEPLLLRLNPLRGIAWIGLRIVPLVLANLLIQGLNAFIGALVFVALWGLPGLALCGWRSRPWMTVIGAVPIYLCGLARHYGRFGFRPPSWSQAAVVALPYAVVLLYGTRLLRPEERARRFKPEA